MKITVGTIVEEMLALWPDMEEPWIYDRGLFYSPPLRIMERALEKSVVPQMEVIDEFNDCDDFALHFLSEFRRKQYIAWQGGNLNADDRFPPALGIAFGDKFRGVEILHQLNIVRCEEGMYFLDAFPDVKRIWKADPANDNVIKLAYM